MPVSERREICATTALAHFGREYLLARATLKQRPLYFDQLTRNSPSHGDIAETKCKPPD